MYKRITTKNAFPNRSRGRFFLSVNMKIYGLGSRFPEIFYDMYNTYIYICTCPLQYACIHINYSLLIKLGSLGR